MKKHNIIQGTLILIATGFITQILLNLINQIVVIRLLGEIGIGIYVLILPTLTLLTTLSNIGFSNAIPTLLSRKNAHKKRILSVVFILTMLTNLVISVFLFIFAKPFSVLVLRDERTYYPLISIIPLLFFLSISSIFRAYFQSKQNQTPAALSMVIGQLVRVIASFNLVSYLIPKGPIQGVLGVILGVIIGEIASIVVLLIIFIKSISHTYSVSDFRTSDLKTQNFKEVIFVSLPTSGTKLIIAISQFLEPIIVLQSLFTIGYTSELSGMLYSAISGFTLPILLMPSFITQALTQAVMPTIGNAYATKNMQKIHQQLTTIFKLSFFANGLFTVLIMLFPSEIMNFFFNTSTGSEHLLFMAPFFLFYFFQTILTATLHSINCTKETMVSTLISSLLKLVVMFVLLPIPRINIQGLLIAIIVHILILTVWQYSQLIRKINYPFKFYSFINACLIIGITFKIGNYLASTFTFSSSATMNMIITMGLTAFCYMFLIFSCGLFPKKEKR